MSKPRKALTRLERHAVLVLTIKRGDGSFVVTEDEAKGMTAQAVISLFDSRINYEHSTPYAISQNNHPTNVTIMTPEDHAPKTKRDVTEIARTKRIERDHEQFRQRLLAKTSGETIPETKPKSRKMQNRPFPKADGKSQWGSRKMQSRGFQKRKARAQ